MMSTTPAKRQIVRGAAFVEGFGFIPCARPIGPRGAPVLWSFGQPFKPSFGNIFKGLADVIFNIGGNPQVRPTGAGHGPRAAGGQV